MSKRTLTVSGISTYKYKPVPLIRVQGIWLRRLGFKIGDKVQVEGSQGEIIIRNQDAIYGEEVQSNGSEE
ncbi:MAG TPA: SymE family type I addiction module toxin [Negativicutes bacterium]|nr:SymE family type I addiction module toxin [Negativicutes bacterium]